MYLFDTNLHLAYLLKDYETDSTARSYTSHMATLSYSEICTTIIILGELDLVVNTTIFKKYNIIGDLRENLKKSLKKYIQKLKDDATLLHSPKEIYHQALENYEKSSTTLSLNDWFILESARANKVKLVTLDQNLRSEAQKQNIPIKLF